MKSVRIEMPDDVHRSLKAKAALNGKPLREYLLGILESQSKKV